MARARGANAKLALAFESSYGVPPGSGFFQMPFASSELGEEQDLIASDLLGQGRDPAAPALDVINDDGDMVVPVDLRAFGQWLKLHFGAPTTTQGVAANGTFKFDDVPVADSAITIGGADWTFKSSGASGDESNIAATLSDTLAAAVRGLNASATTALATQRYDLNANGDTITVTSKTIGTSGNSVTIVAGDDSNATASGADLAGGAASGPYNHVFASGALVLPSAAAEIGNPDVPSFVMNYGVVSDKIAVSLSRSGLLKATVSLIAQGEKPRTQTTAAGSPAAIVLERFTQRTGRISRLGVALSDTVSGSFTCENGYDSVEVIREDGRIAGADPGEASYTGEAVIRFKDTTLIDLATNGTPVDITYGWSIAAGKALSFLFHEVYLPKPKVPISGPSGIQATFDWQGAKNATAGRALTVTLVNDVASYA
jgi:hypothetical protein